MKKISKQEFDKRFFARSNEVLETPVGIELGKLEIGEILSIEFKEWEGSYVSVKLAYIGNKLGGRKFSLRTDKKAEEWLITRIK